MIPIKQSILLLFLLIIALSKVNAHTSFIDKMSSAITKASQYITSYLNPDDSDTHTNNLSKEIAKRKELHDTFTNTVYSESSRISKVHGVHDKNYDKFSERLLQIFPEDKRTVIRDYLKTVRNAEDNDWKFLNIMYTNTTSNTIQFFSLYGNHIGEKSNIYYIDFESNFRMPNWVDEGEENASKDLLAISSFSATSDEIEEIKALPKGMSPVDVRMFMSVVRTKAMREFQKTMPKSEASAKGDL